MAELGQLGREWEAVAYQTPRGRRQLLHDGSMAVGSGKHESGLEVQVAAVSMN